MKAIFLIGISLVALTGRAQGLIGTWQQTESKTCFQAQFEKSETEKELEQSMGGNSKQAVAKIIRFDKKGTGEEGIFSQGKKKGTGLNSFTYSVKGNELQLLDKKSGMITQRFIIDEVSELTLKIHDVSKECESKTFARVK